jgi:hypothetical protein
MGVIALPELPWRKIFGAVAVIVLHIAIVSVLLNATTVRRMFKPAQHETILFLQPLPIPQVKPRAKPVGPFVRRLVPARRLQSGRGIILPQANDETPTATARPGYQLFDCHTANLPKLTEEQRAACAKSAVGPKQDEGDSVDFADHSDRVPGAARWAREKQRKNGPPLLPCASTKSIYATMSTATLLCLAKGVINGFDPDNAPMYGDRPEESHVPNNGDPPPIYSDPDH